MQRGREEYEKYKKIIGIFARIISILPFKIRKKMLEHYRSTKGKKGIAIRYILLKTLCKKCGDNVCIQPDVYIFNVQNLEIGNNVSIHPMSYIECGPKGRIVIGDDVSIAHGVTILAVSHKYSRLDIPIKDQGIEEKQTIIESDVWIGAKATILQGKTIKKGSIIAANCVVTKDNEENSIIGGIPNKIIKKRDE